MKYLFLFLPLFSFAQIQVEQADSVFILTAPTMSPGTSAEYLGTYSWKIGYKTEFGYTEVIVERYFRNGRRYKPTNTISLKYRPITIECVFMEKRGNFQLPIKTWFYRDQELISPTKLPSKDVYVRLR